MESTKILYQNVCDFCKIRALSIQKFEQLCGLGIGTVSRWSKDQSASLRIIDRIYYKTGIPTGYWIKKDGIRKWTKESLQTSSQK